VVAELEDGAVIVERGFAGMRYLVRDVLREAGDAVVLEPEDAREAVRAAAETVASAAASMSG
jgi:proteasome accessory factor C